MRAFLWVLLTSGCVFADESQERRSKLPYIADAIGNTLPPPSNLPAAVGSPVNLLTPDRYEFYTFDESGELIKRLMTLEEIQAIVAAGEETEGLVTFANDNQPTIAFNFSQPPHTKVHSVVTNVQNVLKAQMEAHKNKPQSQPTLDTPDVSDSWSLILPSIFGNTGVDIVPDKTSGSFITPETETFELDQPDSDEDVLLGKEDSNEIFSSTTKATEKFTQQNKFDKITTSDPSSKSIQSSTTLKPTTRKSESKPTLVSSSKISTTGTTIKPKDTITSITTSKPYISTFFTKVNTGTVDQHLSSTTIKTIPMTYVDVSTVKPVMTTKKTGLTIATNSHVNSHAPTKPPTTTERGDIQYEKISTFIPVSYLTESITKSPTSTISPALLLANVTELNPTTLKDVWSTLIPKIQPSTTTYISTVTTSKHTSPLSIQEFEKNNSTTITTQSVSPSSSILSTEFTPVNNIISQNKVTEIKQTNKNEMKESEPALPLFDVAQSISQIASDLEGSYRPLSSSNNLLETTKTNNMVLESKENLEIDIPPDSVKENETVIATNHVEDNFVKVSTIDPHDRNHSISDKNGDKNEVKSTTTTITTPLITITTMDPVLSESIGDLLSQVVNQGLDTQIISEKVTENDDKDITTELLTETTTEYEALEMESTTEIMIKNTETTSFVQESSDADAFNNDKDSANNIPSSIRITISELKKTSDTHENYVPISLKNNHSFTEPKINTSISTTEPTYEKHIDKVQNLSNKTVLFNDVKKVNFTTKGVTAPLNTTDSSYKLETAVSTTTHTNSVKNNGFQMHHTDLAEKTDLHSKNQKDKDYGVVPKVDDYKKKIQKVNIDEKEFGIDRNNSWKLISTVSPSKIQDTTKINKDRPKNDIHHSAESNEDKNIILDFSKENQGLEVTIKDLGTDISQFTELCNELAFRYWNDLTEPIDKKRSFVFSPYSITSMLAMMFMGAKGATSGEMNEILKLDDMVTFNPHFTLKNISDSIETTPAAGISVSAFIRELYSDRSKGKILTFYKERAQHFYNGHVEEVNFKLISDIIRRRTNLLVKRYTWGKIQEYMKINTITLQPPLAAFSANIFHTDCTGSSVEGRDGEMYFVVSPNVRQRRLVPVPAVVFKNNFLAGYDPVLDATAAALGNTNFIVSTLFLMPGQQGNIVHADDLEALEKRFLESNPTNPTWNRLLRTLLPRVGLELQIPRFAHKSVFNVSTTLKRMGLKDLFDAEHADLGGLNGPSKDLYLSDMVQSTTFVTCGEGVIGEQHHIEGYPETLELQKRRSARWINGWDEPRDYQRAFHDPHDVGDAMHLPLHLRPRQARLPARNAQPARLKFDRPFLFFVRHNPSGMILYAGRYNPRLLP